MRDEHGDAWRSFCRGGQRERGDSDSGNLECCHSDGDERLQINGAVVISLVDRRLVMRNVLLGVTREVCVNRCGMMVVVILVDVGMQEGRVHRAGLHSYGQTEDEHPTDHVMILHQTGWIAVTPIQNPTTMLTRSVRGTAGCTWISSTPARGSPGRREAK